MKIWVSNFGPQHSRQLLLALGKPSWLGKFYTALASDKFALGWLPAKLQAALKKRAFPGVPGEKVEHFPLLFLLERLGRGMSPGFSRWIGNCFDWRVARRIRREKPDLVITYENTNLATLRAAKRAGITTILDLAQIHQADIAVHAKAFLSPEQWQAEVDIVNPRKARALEYTDFVITLSSFAADSMLRHGWPAERLFMANLGIDPQRFTLKSRYSDRHGLRLLFVGTMTKRKGLGVLLEALEQLPEQSVFLTLIGPMADAAALIQANRHRVRYLPFLHHEELVRHYQEADVFVFPSLLDSWAQTVLEAMACGTPAIVTENTGAKDAVVQGGGWVIPANDTPALVRLLQDLLLHPEQIEPTGRRAHEIAQQYTWDHYHRQIANILNTITQRNPLNA
ncbi:MAG: glycosyltransferase family 4 protein [Saprospiraceae bacterium]|nr:glycosyltransferase family 4 protein [Saprospiraceae bacterium]